MSISRYSLAIIHTRDDLHVSAFGKDNAFGYLISYGPRYQPLLSNQPIHPDRRGSNCSRRGNGRSVEKERYRGIRTTLMKTTTTVQAQYYSNMDFDHETVGWTSVDMEDNHRTPLRAMKAIEAHKKKYPGATDRKFRIVTTVLTETIEEIR